MQNLIRKAQKGNDQAFLTLFQQYEQDLYRIAFVYVQNKNDALDVVQETAYRSFKSIKNLQEPNYFKTWLTKIAISCSIDLLRKRKNVVQLKTGYYEEVISDSTNEDIDLEITVQDLLEVLNADEKGVIILRFYQDLTIKEVAETLEIPLGTAKTILYRAIAKLRKKYKGDGIHEQPYKTRNK